MATGHLRRQLMFLSGLILVGLCFQYLRLPDNLRTVDTAHGGKYDASQYTRNNALDEESKNNRALEITTLFAQHRSQAPTRTFRTRFEALPEPPSGSCPRMPPFLGKFVCAFRLVIFKTIPNIFKVLTGKSQYKAVFSWGFFFFLCVCVCVCVGGGGGGGYFLFSCFFFNSLSR